MEAADRMKQAGVAFTPLQNARNTVDHEKMRKKILKRFANEEYEQLNQDLVEYGIDKRVISTFFLDQGYSVLDSALSGSASVLPMKFICKNVPLDYLKIVVEQNNYAVIENFLRSQCYMEKLKFYNENVKNTQVEKLEYLLAIDKEGVMEFMERNKNMPYVTCEIKENFLRAVNSKKSIITFFK
jgi:hypothetical protein